MIFAKASLGGMTVGICVILVLRPSAPAQVGTAAISGLITDASGAVVPTAQITLVSTLQQFTRETVSNSAGQYVIPAIPPGRYRLAVKASGFRDETITNIELSAGQASTLNAALRVAEATEQITVVDAPPLLQTANATVGSLVVQQKITELPLAGRNFTNLLLTLPGVSTKSAAPGSLRGAPLSVGNTGINPSIFGQRWRNNNYTIDGVSNNEPLLNGVPLMPPPESLVEMKVEIGMTSGAYGHASGANINLVTKSGSSEYHGDVWEYLRNNVLDARNFFVPQKGPLRWNQFGAAAGGPLVIPKLVSNERAWYVFGYYEGIRIRRAANTIALVATPQQLNGNFVGDLPIFNPYTTAIGQDNRPIRQPFPNNQIPASLLNASAVTIAKTLYPAPNLPAGAIPGSNYFNPGSQRQDGDQWNARVDHQFGKRDNFFARYTDARNPSATVGLPTLPSVSLARFSNAELSNTHIVNPSFLVTGRFGLMRITNDVFTGGDLTLAERAGTLDALPSFFGREVIIPLSITGYLGLSQGIAYYGPQYQFSWLGDAHKTYGMHGLDFGGSLMRVSFVTNNLSGTTVQFTPQQSSNFVSGTGHALASYLLGLPDSASRVLGNTEGDMVGLAYAFYFQDNLRLTPRLTLNLGLRYDYAQPMTNRHGSGTFLYETGQYLWDIKNPITGEPPNVRRGLIDPDRNNFQPRIGIAYQLSPKIVLRAGYGIFFDTYGINYAQTQQGNRGNWPFAFPQSLSGLNATLPDAFFPNPFPVKAEGSRTPLGCQQCLNNWNPTSRTPYVHEWTFSVQRQVTSTLRAEAIYFGTHGVKIASQLIDNTALVAAPGPAAERRRFPGFPPYTSNGYNSYHAYYDGLSLTLDQRLARNLLFSANYTWSKTINFVDELSEVLDGTSALPTRNNLRFWKGPAGWDLSHRFVASYVYEFPFKTSNQLANGLLAHWAMSGIVSLDSGTPFSARLSTDTANIGSIPSRVNQFPNLVGDPSAISKRTPQRWFNTEAFAVPVPFTLGNAGRNILRTDGLSVWDFSAHKYWPVHESRRFEFRAELLNSMNHPTFGLPGLLVGTPQFGTISSTRNAGREVQLALKFQF